MRKIPPKKHNKVSYAEMMKHKPLYDYEKRDGEDDDKEKGESELL